MASHSLSTTNPVPAGIWTSCGYWYVTPKQKRCLDTLPLPAQQVHSATLKSLLLAKLVKVDRGVVVLAGFRP